MKIITWNVNGIRAVVAKGFLEWIKQVDPDILCLQETKAFESQIPAELHLGMAEYDFVWHAGERPGYAGTAIFYKKTLWVSDTKNHFEEFTHFHADGRVTEIAWEDRVLINSYYPNGGERADGTEMLSYKLKFYDDMMVYADALVAKGKKVILTWDFNICHTEKDIARPKENEQSIWFLPVERAKISEFLGHWYVDMWRFLNHDKGQVYSWWSYRAWARPRNVGRRLDYFLVDESLCAQVGKVEYLTSVLGSDHCPVQMELL